MNKKETEIFKYFIARYKHQWDANQYMRSNYDEDLEYYQGYRNPANYPLAYNENFNRILPIIYTIMSRFMDQLYQSGNIVSVKPRKSQNNEQAKKVEALLNFQLENLNAIDMQGGSYLTMYKWFFNALTFGKGLIKAYWRKEERISPRRQALPVPKMNRFGEVVGMDMIDNITMENQTIYDQPYVEVLHNKCCVPDTKEKNIQKMKAFFLVYSKSIDHVKRLVDKGIYSKKGFREMGWDSAGGGGAEPRDSMEKYVHSLHIEGALREEDINESHKSPDVDILECYGKVILKDNAYEVGSGYKIKGMEEEVIAHIGNYKTLLSLQKNTYNIRPVFDIGCYMQPELFWDIGMVRLTKGIQEQTNNLANLRMQNVMMQVNSMLRVDPDADIDPEALVWKPFGIIPANQGEVEPVVVPDYHSQMFQEQQSFFENAIQDMTGMYDYNMGQTPQRQERVGVVHSIQSMGEARAKLMLMTMDYTGIRPLLKYMMTLNTFHLPSGSEYRITEGDESKFGQLFFGDIHPDFDYAARYTSMEPALGRLARAQQLLQLSPIIQQNPWINQHQWLKTIFELSDIREANALVKNPQQFQQEMMANQKAQMMAEQAVKQLETESTMAISDKDFREELAVNEQELKHELIKETQEFKHDLALEGIKNEKSDKSV